MKVQVRVAHRVERTVNAFSHDIASGSVFYKPKISEGFMSSYSYPTRCIQTQSWSQSRLVSKPDDWPSDDRRQKNLIDLSSNNIQETGAIADESYFPEVIPRHGNSAEQVFSAKLRSKVVLNQTVYTLHVGLKDRLRPTRSGPTSFEACRAEPQQTALTEVIHQSPYAPRDRVRIQSLTALG
jgi:hypothetical protein